MSTKTFLTKFIFLIFSLIVGMIVSNLTMLGLLYLNGLEITDLMNLSNLLNDSQDGTVIFLSVGLSHLLLFTGSAILFWKCITEVDFTEYFNLRFTPRPELIGWFTLLLFAAYPIIGASGLLGDYFNFPDWMKSMDSEYAEALTGMLAGDGLGKLILNIIIISVLPAIGEELIFRGIIQKELHGVLSNPHLVILITSIVFSGIHLQAEGFLPKLLISYILCYTYYWTKNLWYPVILHFINNASMTLALFFGKEQMESLENMDTTAFPWGGVAISLFLCTVIVYKIISIVNTNELQKGQIANE